MPSVRSSRPFTAPEPALATTVQRRVAKTPGQAAQLGMIFELTPCQLRQHWGWLDVQADTSDVDDAVDRPDQLTGLDDETELEDRDADAVWQDEEPAPWEELAVSLYGDVQADAGPLLDFSDIYALRVLPASEKQWACRFEALGWMRQAPDPIRPHLERLCELLEGLAKFLETDKQQFLRAPGITTYLDGETDFNAMPIVTQKGLLERLNKTLPEDARFGDAHFSRLLKNDKVWILWPDACMPLTALFDRSFKLAWAVQGCLALQPAQAWRQAELSVPTWSERSRAIGVENQSPEERLATVAHRTGLGAQDILRAVMATRDAPGHEVAKA